MVTRDQEKKGKPKNPSETNNNNSNQTNWSCGKDTTFHLNVRGFTEISNPNSKMQKVMHNAFSFWAKTKAMHISAPNL